MPIINPFQFTEAKVQHELYRRAYWLIKHLGIMPEFSMKGSPRLRADLAFYDMQSHKVVALVEVKRAVPTSQIACTRRRNSKQFSKYEATGIPWRYCQGTQEIDATIRWVLKTCPKGE